jgi:hypothetical protein
MAQQAEKMYRVYTIVERPKQDAPQARAGSASERGRESRALPEGSWMDLGQSISGRQNRHGQTRYRHSDPRSDSAA